MKMFGGQGGVYFVQCGLYGCHFTPLLCIQNGILMCRVVVRCVASTHAHHVHEEGEGHENCDLQGDLLPGVGGEVEAEHRHAETGNG